MVVLNAAILSLLLPAAVLARPNQHEKLHMKHKRHGDFSDIHPNGIHGGPPTNVYPHPTGSSTIAPYPVENSTSIAPTGSVGTSVGTSVPGGGVVTISSVISIVPVPMSSGQTVPAESQGSSPTGPNGPGGSSGPGGPNGPSSPGGQGQEECGPATVTVTSAKTVTVTVPGAGAQSSTPPSKDNSPPTKPQSKPESKPETHPESKPESKPETHPQSNPEQKAASKPEQKPQSQPETKPMTKPQSQPESKPEDKSAEQSSPVGNTPQNAPNAQSQSESKPEEKSVEQFSPVGNKEQDTSKPKTQEKAQTSNEDKSSKEDTSSSAGGKRGILYKTLEEANGMNGMSWGTNWDSSPIPAIGHAQGKLNFEFVPQLWGPDTVHTDVWPGNSKGAKYVMAFNEPNQPKGAGGCDIQDATQAVGPYEENMKPNKDAGQKIISPCVSNEAHTWLDTFLGATSLKPDAVCFHWYGQNKQELEGVVETFQGLQSKYGIAELWLTEFAVNGGVSADTIKEVISYLDSSPVDRYAYNAEKMLAQPGCKEAYQS